MAPIPCIAAEINFTYIIINFLQIYIDLIFYLYNEKKYYPKRSHLRQVNYCLLAGLNSGNKEMTPIEADPNSILPSMKNSAVIL
ncbi:MAG: hypothetical protein BWX77_00631 [Bacteroidetes bacterium ADurb.Bin090]|jgi:hypothetical protein|nr:MAG: hypothetical protein BWX77_00631 [Bacteroidetes bacterium ADurb.Bin090]